MIGGNSIINTLSVTSVDGLAKKTTRTISSECLNQQNFNQNAFSAQIIGDNMRQLYAASTNSYEDTTLRAAVSIGEIENE